MKELRITVNRKCEVHVGFSWVWKQYHPYCGLTLVVFFLFHSAVLNFDSQKLRVFYFSLIWRDNAAAKPHHGGWNTRARRRCHDSILLVVWRKREGRCRWFFLKKNLEDTSPFCGATNTPVLDFWWGFKARLDLLLVCFTSGVTPADCIEVNMATKPFQSMYLQIMSSLALIWVWTCDHVWHNTAL